MPSQPFLGYPLWFHSFFTQAILNRAAYFFTLSWICQDTRYVVWSKNTGHATSWVYWQVKQSNNFHASVAPWCLIQMAPNLLWRCPLLRGSCISNLKKIPSTIPEIRVIKLSKKFSLFSLILLLFAHCTKIAVTCKRILQSGWYLDIYWKPKGTT